MKISAHQAKRTLFTGLISVVILCICIFTVSGIYLSKASSSTIKNIGTFYMSSTGKQVANHFETTMDLCLSQRDTLIKTIPQT